jgi:hypothetical protein
MGDVQGADARSAGALATTDPTRVRRVSARTPTLEDVAWLVVVPTAVLITAAILLLGPPLGHTFLKPARVRFWSYLSVGIRPEPVEHARYLIALAAPLLLAAFTALAARMLRRRRVARLDALVVGSQILLIAFVSVCVLQAHEVFGQLYAPDVLLPPVMHYFSVRALLIALVATAAVVPASRSAWLRERWPAWTRERRGQRLATTAIALAAIVVWLSHAIYTEDTIGAAPFEVFYHLMFTMDESFAVLNGHTPLVDYTAQYGSLWPYAFAAGMSAFGTSVGVWVALALCATGVGMLAIFGVLRRVARSSVVGLMLFLPVLATSFFMIGGTLQSRYTFGSYFGTFPLRYAGPSILVWLLVRHLEGARACRTWVLCLGAGLVTLNNADVGIPALGATVVALAASNWRAPRAAVGRLTLEAACGLAAALALVSILTLARAGALPDLGRLMRFSRLFASAGFGMYAMPAVGLHLAIYVTFVAALGVAAVRVLKDEPDRLLTATLAWSGVFGLGAGTYFVGRSTPDDLPAVFFPWSFALVLLAIPAFRSLATAPLRRLPIAALLCVFGYVLLCCSLAQTPTPWEQVERLNRAEPPILAPPAGQSFVAQHVHRGEPVAILLMLGHRIAVNLGIDNIAPYANRRSMSTVEQFKEALAALRSAAGDKVFVEPELTTEQMRELLSASGFIPADNEPGGRAELWLDVAHR